MTSKVILIGGTSCAGKTTVARALARRLGLEHLELDRLRQGFDESEETVLPASPSLWEQTPETLVVRLVAIARTLIPHVNSVVRQHADVGLVLDGEGIHPEMLARLGELGMGGGVLVVEDDAARLHRALLRRSENYRALDGRCRRAVVEMNQGYGIWLRNEGKRLGIPIVASKPWDTLGERVLGAFRPRANRP